MARCKLSGGDAFVGFVDCYEAGYLIFDLQVAIVVIGAVSHLHLQTIQVFGWRAGEPVEVGYAEFIPFLVDRAVLTGDVDNILFNILLYNIPGSATEAEA